MNAGKSFELRSLAALGERSRAESVLAGVKMCTDHPVGPALFIDTFNHYWEAGVQPLLTEPQTTIDRLIPDDTPGFFGKDASYGVFGH
jgi:hypothetical protein